LAATGADAFAHNAACGVAAYMDHFGSGIGLLGLGGSVPT
jgi:hypothetical protein